MSLGYNEVTKEPCLIREMLDRVGDKRSVLIVTHLGAGPKRFNELKRAIDGISQRMLTLMLRGLERDWLVTRTVYPTVPPRVEFALTRLGETLLEPVLALSAWTDEHFQEVQRARERFDLEVEAPASRSK